MLLINWKKHYSVPTLFYTESDFRSSRKGKFFFLSDFVFKLIHRFCFKYILYEYIVYMFYRRINTSCLNITNVLYRSSVFLKGSSLKKPFIDYFLKNSLVDYKIKKTNLKIRFLFKFICFKVYLTKLKENMNYNFLFFNSFKIKKNALFIFYFLLKKNKVSFLNFIFYHLLYKFYFFLDSKSYKGINSHLHYFNKMNWNRRSNNYDIFYKFRLLGLSFNIRSLIFNNKSKFILLIIKNLKPFFKTVNNLHSKDIEIKNQTSYFWYKCKVKKINIGPSNTKLFYNYFNYFLKTFYNTLYYFFFSNKIIHLKYDNLLNFFNFNNLKLKKELIFIFRKKYLLFSRNARYFRFKFKRLFYRFLNKLLNQRQWLIGPINKIKMFKYTTYMANRISYYFRSLQVNNSVFYRNVYFFYNAVKIREQFFFFLGKRRYKEEFILLKNKKWYLKYYLKQFYNLNFKLFLNFYKFIKKKFKVKYIKDLFLFLEYNISIFMKKHLFYTFSCFNSFYLNMKKVNLDIKHLFFIGNVIDMNTTFFYYYEKFFVFFNFIYFIDPIYFKKKYMLLSFLYNKIYVFFNNNNDFFVKLNNFFISKLKKSNSILLFKNSQICTFFLNKIKHLNYKLFIKSIYFFFFKYNFILKTSSYINDKFFSSKKNFINKKTSYNFKNLLYIYSFDKSLFKYNLIKFKNTFVTKKRKKIKYFSRRKRTTINFYNWFSYKKKRSFLYKKKISRTFNKRVHNIFFRKKMFFLKKKHCFKWIYLSNF